MDRRLAAVEPQRGEESQPATVWIQLDASRKGGSKNAQASELSVNRQNPSVDMVLFVDADDFGLVNVQQLYAHARAWIWADSGSAVDGRKMPRPSTSVTPKNQPSPLFIAS